MFSRAAQPHERRTHARSEYRSVLHLQSAGEATWFAVYGIDVSAGGFAFVSDYEMRRGERLAVAVPEFDTLTVAAVVRHVERNAGGGWFVGIEFDEALPPQLERCLGG
ncbi:MAG TPA: PilZ domain-containing protein [Polyangia bacterium]|nr:PilZ domain-containing protein [Polyangia bacterium]